MQTALGALNIDTFDLVSENAEYSDARVYTTKIDDPLRLNFKGKAEEALLLLNGG